MSKNGIIGQIVCGLPGMETKNLRVIAEVTSCLNGNDSDALRRHLLQVLRNPPTEKKDGVIRTCPIPDGHSLIIPPNDGTKTIAQASDVFGYIDRDFKNWGLDVPSSSSVEMLVTVREMIKDGGFQKIFGELGDIPRLCLTQGQIIDFARLHKEWLLTDGYGTFFLFRKGDDFFVAAVGAHSDGRLEVRVRQFLYDYVWHAEYRHRLVIPQLTL